MIYLCYAYSAFSNLISLIERMVNVSHTQQKFMATSQETMDEKISYSPGGTGIIPGDHTKVNFAVMVPPDPEPPQRDSNMLVIEPQNLWITTGLFQLESPDKSLLIDRDGGVTSPAFNFHLLKSPWYHLTIRVNGPYGFTQILDVPVTWSADQVFTTPVNPGQAGPNLTIQAAYYDVRGTALEGKGTFVLLYAPQTGAYSLVRARDYNTLLSTRGGNGLAGQDGATAVLEAGQHLGVDLVDTGVWEPQTTPLKV